MCTNLWWQKSLSLAAWGGGIVKGGRKYKRIRGNRNDRYGRVLDGASFTGVKYRICQNWSTFYTLSIGSINVNYISIKLFLNEVNRKQFGAWCLTIVQFLLLPTSERISKGTLHPFHMYRCPGPWQKGVARPVMQRGSERSAVAQKGTLLLGSQWGDQWVEILGSRTQVQTISVFKVKQGWSLRRDSDPGGLSSVNFSPSSPLLDPVSKSLLSSENSFCYRSL